jgi:3-oxoacyl-[acyl-carrier-protein] synthase-3
LRTDGSYVKTLYVPAGGSLKPATADTVRRNEHTITMNGKEVFKIAVRSMEEISRQALAEAGVEIGQVSLVVPHQANRRIIVALAERLGVPIEKVVVNVEKYGNTSAASIPVALDEAKRQGRIKPGDIVLLNAFGGGFSWGAAVVKF